MAETIISQNILGNAEKYAAGSPVEIKMEDQEQYAVIRIKDCGPGIPRRTSYMRSKSSTGEGMPLISRERGLACT